MTTKQEKILIVDDEKSVRQVICQKLASEGYHCPEAANAKQALDKLKRNSIELVILDIKMPGKSGIQLLPEIREHYPDTAVIMATIVGDTDTAFQCMRQGAFDYITKPLNLDELVLSVDRALEMRRLRLIEFNKQYRVVFESANDVLLVLDRKGNILDVNEKLKEIGGYEREDLVGENIRSLTKLMSKRSLAIVVKNFLKRIAGFNVPPYEVEMVTKSGEWLTIEINAVAMRREGKVIGDLAILRDVTERKRMEKAITETNAKLQVLQQVTEAVHSSLDLERVFKQITDAATYSLGYTTAFIMTLNNEKKRFEIKAISTRKRLLPQIGKILGFSLRNLSIPADSDLNPVVGLVMKGRIAVVRTLAEIAYPVISKERCSALQKLGGTSNYILAPLKVEEQMAGAVFISSPRAEVSEEESRMVQHFADVASQAITNASLYMQTERAEKALRQSESNIKAYLESAPDGVYINDLKGTFLCGNKKAEEVIGYKREELIGKSFLDLHLLPAGQLAKAGKALVLNAMGRSSGPDEFELIRQDGSTIWVEISTTPIKQEGKVVVIGFVRDITERKRAEAEIKQLYEQVKAFNVELEERIKERTRELEIAVNQAEAANQAKSEFLSGMSHELRTPLTAIIGFSQVLAEQYFGELNEKQAEYAKDILESGEHLLSLINDVLDLAKVEAGKAELELSKVNMKELLESSLVMIKEKALKHSLSLEARISPVLDDLLIMADQRRLKQVMFNLLSNATKFTPDHGQITVEATREGGELIVSVADTGIGIVPKDQRKIFNEFYQAHSGPKDKTPGTGLGLPLSKSFIEMHGGRIWVESGGKGKGSRFTFSLPIREANQEEEKDS